MVRGVAVQARDAAVIYAGVGSAVVKCIDGGETWTYRLRLGDRPIFDARQPDTVYAAAQNHGVYKSKDGGASWIRLAGFPGNSVSALTISPPDGAL